RCRTRSPNSCTAIRALWPPTTTSRLSSTTPSTRSPNRTRRTEFQGSPRAPRGSVSKHVRSPRAGSFYHQGAPPTRSHVPSAIERRIVFGDFRPDLEDALASAVAAHRHERGPLAPPVLLVASNLLGLYLTRLLARRLGAVGGLRAMTFLDLPRPLARAGIDCDGLRASPVAGDRLRPRVPAKARPDSSSFASIGRTAGVAEAIPATLRDVRDAALTPGDLRRCLPKGQRKARDLSDVHERYEEKLKSARLIDRPGLMARALAVLERDAAGTSTLQDGQPFAGMTRLFVYGFYDFTWLQENLLLRFARILPTAIFSPYRGTPAFA